MVEWCQMAGPIDLCKLCLNVKELRDSHLLSASVYKKLRSVYASNPDNLNPDPIAVTSGKARQTSKQTTDYLLCSDCEGILDRVGEKHVLPLLADSGGFPLYDLLTNSTPNSAEADLSIYLCANVPSLDCEKITHFATGIFWRAAVHSWRSGTSTVKLDLGRHEEQLREYLLGAKPFPDDVLLILRIAPPSLPLLWAVAPASSGDVRLGRYRFYVPGIEFSLHVEEQAVRELWEGCFVHNPAHPVFVDPDVALMIGKLYRDTFLPAEKSTRLSAGLQKRRERLSGHG
jgi:hypothetical protein